MRDGEGVREKEGVWYEKHTKGPEGTGLSTNYWRPDSKSILLSPVWFILLTKPATCPLWLQKTPTWIEFIERVASEDDAPLFQKDPTQRYKIKCCKTKMSAQIQYRSRKKSLISSSGWNFIWEWLRSNFFWKIWDCVFARLHGSKTVSQQITWNIPTSAFADQTLDSMLICEATTFDWNGCFPQFLGSVKTKQRKTKRIWKRDQSKRHCGSLIPAIPKRPHRWAEKQPAETELSDRTSRGDGVKSTERKHKCLWRVIKIIRREDDEVDG